MIRLVNGGWDKEFRDALRANTSELRIICPFIKEGVIDHLHLPGNVQVITRFNLADYAEGVSDLAALRNLLKAGARIRGVRNLHAKLYIFGTNRAIITSANLTETALSRNYEFGLVAEDETVIAQCGEYFNDLWNRAEEVFGMSRSMSGIRPSPAIAYWEMASVRPLILRIMVPTWASLLRRLTVGLGQSLMLRRHS